jgi:membrane-associated phospholipid phosphatase
MKRSHVRGVWLAAIAVFALGMGRVASAEEPLDPVLFWNDQTNRAIQFTRTDAFSASRALALESIAVLDTVRSLDGAPCFLLRLPAASGLAPRVAVSAAAWRMLSHLFPSQRDALDAAFRRAVAGVPADSARERSEAVGAAVADAVYAARDRDGWNAPPGTPPEIALGTWRPTPPNLLPPLASQWANMTPFVMNSPRQFRPPAPPALESSAFRAATEAVRTIGQKDSPTRTATQTEIAHYWSDAIGTYAPAGHWNAITARLLAPMGLGLDAEAELFARLNIAMADAGIAMADAKYTWWFWRPITVIRSGGDGTAPRPDWSSLLETPSHPSYVSGHSAFSGAAAVVLTAMFGDRPFSFVSDSMPGVTRSFASFQQAAEEAAASRVYGGIHFPFDNAAGLATGRMVGTWTLSFFRRLAEDRGPLIVMDHPDAANPWRPREVAGYVLDNAVPVTAVTVHIDGAAAVTAPVDARGRFAVRTRQGAMPPHEVVVTARDGAGRVGTAKLDLDGGAEHGINTAPVSVK